MIKKIRALIFSSLTAFALLVPAVAAPVVVRAADADIDGALCAGANLDVKDTTCDPAADTAPDKVNSLIGTIINIFSVVVGVVAVIMIIVGGIKFVLSGGDSAATTSARNTILYAIVGLVIVALAQIIVRFVLVKVNPSSS